MALLCILQQNNKNNMRNKKYLLSIAFLMATAISNAQNTIAAIDSVKIILNSRYKALSKAHDEQDLKKILNFKTSDFHACGPDGKILDHIEMKEYSRQFITNNIPPYNIKNTILNLRLSYNKLVAVVDVLQESTRKRELLGKIRDVKTSALQTETWIFTKKQWKLKLVDNIHDQKRFIDDKRVDPTKPFNPNDLPFDPDTKN